MERALSFDASPEGLLSLIRMGESPLVEFKARLPPDEEVARHLTAFANGQGGILLIGVGENGDLGSLPPWEVEKVVAHLKRVGESVLFEPPYVNATKVDPHWVAYVLVSKAPSHLRPIRTATGEVYERVGTTVSRTSETVTAPVVCPISEVCRVFVAMSFRVEEEPALVDYFAAMERAVKQANLPLKLERIDRVEGDYEISQEVMNEIDKAQIVIVDFTLSPQNVYFEAGYARGRGKRLIQTARKGVTLEFDTRNWRTIFYRNATELEEALVPALVKAYEEVARAADLKGS